MHVYGADDRVRTGDLNLGKTPKPVQPVETRVIPCAPVRPERPCPCSGWDAGWDEWMEPMSPSSESDPATCASRSGGVGFQFVFNGASDP